MVHKKYHLEQNSDVYSSLVPAIFHSYFRDVKNGNITQDGQIKNVEKSAVMRVVHNFEDYGVPIDAKKTVAEVKESTKNADQEALYALKEFVHAIGSSRQEELNKFLPQHQNEIENLPQILKVRMKALKEVNPEKFSNSPELVLSTLAAADLIKQFPNGADKL